MHMRILNTTLKKHIAEALGKRRNNTVNEMVRKYAKEIEQLLEGEKKVKVKISLAEDVYNTLEQLSNRHGVSIGHIIELIVERALKDKALKEAESVENKAESIDTVEKFYRELKDAVENRVYDIHSQKLSRAQALAMLHRRARVRAKINITPEELTQLEQLNVVKNTRVDGGVVEFEPGEAFDVSRLNA